MSIHGLAGYPLSEMKQIPRSGRAQGSLFGSDRTHWTACIAPHTSCGGTPACINEEWSGSVRVLERGRELLAPLFDHSLPASETLPL